jgi:hypothetical protein
MSNVITVSGVTLELGFGALVAMAVALVIASPLRIISEDVCGDRNPVDPILTEMGARCRDPELESGRFVFRQRIPVERSSRGISGASARARHMMWAEPLIYSRSREGV